MSTIENRSFFVATVVRSRGRLALTVLLLVAATIASLALPALLAHAVDAILQRSTVVGPAALLGAVILVTALCEVGLGMLGASVVGRGTVLLQTRVVRHLLGLGTRSQLPAGEAAARLAQGAAPTAALPMTIIDSLVSVAGSVTAFVALSLIDWRAGLALLAAVPVTIVIAKRFVGDLTAAQEAYLTAQSGIVSRLLTALAGARTIRAAGTASTEVRRVLRPLPQQSAAGRAMWRLQRKVVWQIGLLVPLTNVVVMAVAGYGVAVGRTSPAQLLAVLGYLSIAAGVLDEVDVLFELAHIRAASRRVSELLEPPLPAEGGLRADDGAAMRAGALSFRGIRAVRDGDVVLDGLNLDIPPGTSVALVGRSGSGKSLLGALVGRLVDPDAGQVLLDGVPVSDLTLADLRQRVAYAFDHPQLIGDTIRDAIAYGRPELSDVDVLTAARAAYADGFIRRMPGGYGTRLADAPMSGGERQRVGLARALARRASVYVLDDATSGLDTVTEAEVSNTMTVLLDGRTRLLVCHRVATAARCDLVAWLDGGRIAALGPHAQLWHDPAYRAVFGEADVPETATPGTPAGRTREESAHV